MKIKKALLEMTSESYADDNIKIPEDTVDCTLGCNPYGSVPELMNVVKNTVVDMIYNYPHDQEIYEEIENYWKPYAQVEKHNIIIADGSIGALELIAEVFDEEGASAVSLAPTFTDATMSYKSRGMDYRYVALSPDSGYAYDVDALVAEINDRDSIVYIDNPNNPTGQTISLGDIEKIAAAGEKHDAAVVVDEAYGDFIPPCESAVSLLGRFENLIVVRTFSKAYGMAGMRAGYIIAGKTFCDNVRKMSDPYKMNELARRMGAEALRHSDFALSHMDDFVKCKQMLRSVTGNKIQMAATDDRVPIALLWHTDPDFRLASGLVENGVLAVDAWEFDCLGSNAVRLRVPRIEQMEKVLDAVAKLNEG